MSFAGSRTLKRFYKDVTVGDGFAILLDGKPVKTRGNWILALPQRALAEAIAAEWSAQGETIDPQSMPLFRLANTALESVAPKRDAVIDATLGYARSDLLCYRAASPQELIARQSASWDPLLEWLAERYGAPLTTTSGVIHVAQSDHAIAALRDALAALGDFALTGISAATPLLGSLVLGLALLERRLDAADAFRLATLDETFQAEQWGEDAEARARLDAHASELTAIARFLQLVRI